MVTQERKVAGRALANYSEDITLTLKGKGKEEYLYSAFFPPRYTQSAQACMDHTVLPANNTMPAFPSWRSPDVTTTATEAADIQLQLTTHLSTLKG